jgi:pyridoxal 5'-phosphate synthase pdxS subunit
MRAVVDGIRHVQSLSSEQLMAEAKNLQAPYELVQFVHDNCRLPVVNFCAGGVATPADAALMMQLGADGIFVGSGVFKSDNPAKRAEAIVEATTHFEDATIVANASRGLGEAMRGIEISAIPERELLATRGW